MIASAFKKRALCAFVAAAVHAPALLAGESLPAVQTSSSWYTDGESLLTQKVEMMKNEAKAKNVILFVGDGMGVSTLTAARIFEGQQLPDNQGGEEHFLSFENFHHSALIKTYNTNQQTPDSAGTMTAMVTGVKTKAGMLSVSDSSLRGNCLSSKGEELTTAIEMAETLGKSTGVISTARLTHATPAATYAHGPERNWEDDGDLPSEAVANGCADIARQLIEFPYGDGLEVAMGGGRRHFIPQTAADPEDEGSSGNREDGRDLTAEWTANYENAAYVWNLEQFNNIDPATTNHLLGLFNRSHMEYETDRPQDTAGEPSLTDMTVKAIDILEKNEDGFFLMVESGRIDHAHHAGNAFRAMEDTVEFAEAVQAAVDSVDLSETLILVTADHSHVFTIAGYPTRGNPILGLTSHNDSDGSPSGELSTDINGLPYTTVGYTNGPGFGELGDSTYTDGVRVDLTNIDTTAADFRQEAQVPMGSETHAGEDITLHATGASAYMTQGVMEQNAVFHIINQAAELGGTKY